ncbi:hypothetical protein ACFWIB_14645 [Streptomyces sp. NPDC127051]|uniref:hypothetical protein n=1 Tax=Streptomyces sp. NPDC127051 TaxID=3347119 RepID=UPI003666D098
MALFNRKVADAVENAAATVLNRGGSQEEALNAARVEANRYSTEDLAAGQRAILSDVLGRARR